MQGYQDTKIKQLLYITWVRSSLEYTCAVWSLHTKRNILVLERIQHRATRFIAGRYLSHGERLNCLHLLPLVFHREIIDIAFLFKCPKNIYNIDIFSYSYVSFRSCNMPLRKIDNLTLKVPFSRTESFKSSSVFRTCLSFMECFTLEY
jgi:hypothetical protein